MRLHQKTCRLEGQGKTRLGLILPDHEFVRRNPTDETNRDKCSNNGCKPAIARDVLTWYVYVHAPNTYIINSFSKRSSIECELVITYR